MFRPHLSACRLPVQSLLRATADRKRATRRTRLDLAQNSVAGVRGSFYTPFSRDWAVARADRPPEKGLMLSRAHPRSPGRSQAWLRLAVGMVLCALALRSVLPAPIPVLVSLGPETGLVAVFGEHVICRPGAADTDPGRVPPQSPSPDRDRHGDHHGAWCCHWHAGPALIPLAASAAIRIVFAALANRVEVAAIAPPTRS
jgi:hypothetical protein